MKSKTFVVDIISMLFIILFMYAATSKMVDFEKFQIQLGQSPLLTPFASIVVWIIPVLEIVISIMIVVAKTRMVGLYAAFSLMVLFSFYIFAITRYSYYIPCSCGGILQHMTWNQHLIFNLFFVAIGSVAILLDDSPNFLLQ